MSDQRIVVCSNRGPVTASTAADGTYVFHRTRPNGLVPVVFPSFAERGGTWVYASRSDTDREIAARGPVVLDAGAAAVMTLHPVTVPQTLEKQYYEEFSVGVLAKIFHYLCDLPRSPSFTDRSMASWDSYCQVNDLFAATLARDHRDTAIVVHDYHLLLTGAGVRELEPYRRSPLVYFHHVTWCDPAYFGVLPRPIRHRMLSAMTAFDVVAFHSRRWADSFLACCRAYLPDARPTAAGLRRGDREVRVVVEPAAIDRADLLHERSDPRFGPWCARITAERRGRWTLARVERADLWKNPLRGLLAVEAFLDRHEPAVGQVWFPWVLTPTRPWAPEYREYLAQCQAVAARINERYARAAGGPPVRLFIAEDHMAPDRALALALLSISDGVMTTPTFDGLNITAKEALHLNERFPVVIVSENSGIAEELGDSALNVNPFDLNDMAEAIASAFFMAPEERRRRAVEMRAVVAARTPSTWMNELIPKPRQRFTAGAV